MPGVDNKNHEGFWHRVFNLLKTEVTGGYIKL